MTAELLYRLPVSVIFVVLLAAMAAADEAGFRLGRRSSERRSELTRTQVTGIQAALLGLLSLLLGFTFAMALSRFEYRKQMVVNESNAIGTAALRAQVLPESRDAAVEALFRRYVGIRLESVLETAQQSTEREQLDAEARQIQQRLWRIAMDAEADDPRSVPYGLFTQSLNEMIDIKMQRDIAVANHVPESVILFLLGSAILTAAVLGYGNGTTGTRSTGLTLAYLGVVLLTVLLVVDLDRPQQGLARVSQSSMMQLGEILDAGRR